MARWINEHGRRVLLYESPEEWRDWYYERGLLEARNNWIEGKRICISRAPAVSAAVVPASARGARRMLAYAGLDFSVESAVIDQRTLRDIRACGYSNSTPWAFVRKRERGGQQYADVALLANYFREGGKRDKGEWGLTAGADGVALLFLPPSRQQHLALIEQITEHETGHLFGADHHGMARVPGYAEGPCVLDIFGGGTYRVCRRDIDAMRAFWSGVERATGEAYLKPDIPRYAQRSQK